MRCFIAIDIAEDIKKSINGVIEKIDHKSNGIRWVPLENIHLTLKFLGEVDENMISDIKEKLSAICDTHKIFDMRIHGIGAFPNFKYPNILWVGVDASKELKDLFEAIEESMSELGFEKEGRQFSPHLTIARIKDKKIVGSIVQAIYSFKDHLFGNVNVKEVLLMKSILKPTGAEYSKIATFMLADKRD